MSLHPHQAASLDAIRGHFRQGKRSVLYQLSTGGGKTYGAVEMIGGAVQRGKRAWFIVHRRELVAQSVAAFRAVGLIPGVVQAGESFRPALPIQVCAIQTLKNRLDQLPAPDLVVQDECHHILAKTWDIVYQRHRAAKWVGLTATPERLDGAGLSGHFEAMVCGPTMEWLIANGYLCPFRIFAAPPVDLSGVTTRAGDFAKGALGAKMDSPTITGDAVQQYRKHAAGRSAILFAASIAHSHHVVESFRAAGISAYHVDGETDPMLRAQAIAALERGELQVLSNVDLFGEGVSVNNVACIIQMRPTQSLTLHLQQIGRGLRMNAGKTDCIILDHAGNTERHGFPDDDREWSLEGRGDAGRSDADGLGVRVCPQCFAAMRAGTKVCSYCDHTFAVTPREVATVAGDLVEVDREAIRAARKQEQWQARTLEDLVALGEARRYPNPHGWARRILLARRGRMAGAA